MFLSSSTALASAFADLAIDNDMPKAHGYDCKQWVKEGWIRAVALLRL